MFKILFSEGGPRVCIAEVLKVEDAIQFALNLHRSSNVKHFISVVDPEDKIVLILETKIK